jgi:uncharacterized protein
VYGIPFWIWLVGVPALATLGALSVAALVLRLVLFVLRRRPRRYFRPFYRAHRWIAPFVILLAGPLVLGYFGTHGSRTRGDESHYAGPTLSAQGEWVAAQRRRGSEESVAKERSPFAIDLEAADGVALRAYSVAPRDGVVPRAAVVLVHGLYRGGLEIDPVAAMLRDLGAVVMLLELRNHGGSDSARSTYGIDERLDVLAAVATVRADARTAALPIVLFGVSLGAAAVSLAAPELAPPPAAIVLDSPMARLEDVADRLMRDEVGLPMLYRVLTARSLELFGGFQLSAVSPEAVLPRLHADVAALVIGGEDDHMMPPAEVRRVDAALTVRDKVLWFVPGAEHGKAWKVDPDGYRARLGELLDKVAPIR